MEFMVLFSVEVYEAFWSFLAPLCLIDKTGEARALNFAGSLGVIAAFLTILNAKVALLLFGYGAQFGLFGWVLALLFSLARHEMLQR